MRGVELLDIDIDGEIENVSINGVSIGPLVNAELNRRYPQRAPERRRPPAGSRLRMPARRRVLDAVVGAGGPSAQR
jgi:hypothetical protein